MAIALMRDDNPPQDPPLWDPHGECFDGPRLRLAILSRGWTVEEFAALMRRHPNTVRNLLRGHKCMPRTAIRVFETLERRQPMGVRG